MLLFGRRLPASEVLQGGLVGRVLWPDRFDEQVYNIAKDIASQPTRVRLFSIPRKSSRRRASDSRLAYLYLDTAVRIFVGERCHRRERICDFSDTYKIDTGRADRRRRSRKSPPIYTEASMRIDRERCRSPPCKTSSSWVRGSGSPARPRAARGALRGGAGAPARRRPAAAAPARRPRTRPPPPRRRTGDRARLSEERD